MKLLIISPLFAILYSFTKFVIQFGALAVFVACVTYGLRV